MQTYTKQEKIKFDELFGNKNKPGNIEKVFFYKTIKYLKFIKWIPGLKMIGIGNSIAMNSAKKESDIDLFIVTENNTMWFTRVLITFIFQILGVRKTKKNHIGRFCLSFFCTIDGLNFSDFALKKDPYLYFWILYFKPILDYSNTYSLFIKQNKIWADFSKYKSFLIENRKYIKIKGEEKRVGKWIYFLDFIFKKIFLQKTLKHYNKIGKPYGIIINDNILKFHNGDIRKKVASKIK